MEELKNVESFKHKLVRPQVQKKPMTKADFLKTVKFDSKAYEKFIDDTLDNVIKGKTCFEGVGDSDGYVNNIRYNAHNDSEINFKELENFCRKLYLYWYENLQYTDLDKVEPYTRDCIKEILNDEEYKPENMAQFGYYWFFTNVYDNRFNGSGLRMIHKQGSFLWEDGQNIVTEDGFLHIYNPFRTREKTDVRLYLNLKGKNIIKVASKLYGQSLKNKSGLYMKFLSNDKRNDTLLIYTSYEKVQEKIDWIRGIKKEHPELFEGCEKKSPMLGTIDGFIGFAEEPVYQKSSFNSERQCIPQMCKKELFKTLNKVINSDAVIRNSNGEYMNVDDYLAYRIKSNFIETIEKELEETKKTGKIPKETDEINKKYLKSYIQGQEILLKGLKESNTFDKFIDKSVQDYKDYIQYNSSINTLSINFKTKQADWACQEDSGKQFYNMFKSISIPELNEKMLKVFPEAKKELQSKLHDQDLQKQYYGKNHVSTSLPYLNLESELELQL